MNKNKTQDATSKRDQLLKLSKSISITNWILILVGLVLLGMTIYFALSYFSAVNERKDLDRQVTQKQQQINSIGAPQNIAALQSQLESILEDMEEDSPFPSQISNTDVAYTIIQAAKEASIDCYQYSSAGISNYIKNEHIYTENIYSITSQGTTDSTGSKIARITKFLELLEEAYDTAMITGLGMSDADGDDQWTIDFKYSIILLPSQ